MAQRNPVSTILPHPRLLSGTLSRFVCPLPFGSSANIVPPTRFDVKLEACTISFRTLAFRHGARRYTGDRSPSYTFLVVWLFSSGLHHFRPARSDIDTTTTRSTYRSHPSSLCHTSMPNFLTSSFRIRVRDPTLDIPSSRLHPCPG